MKRATSKAYPTDTKVPRAGFPLRWPAGRPRLPDDARRDPRFRAGFEAAYDGLVDELARIGAASSVISTAVPLRQDGLPVVSVARRVADPGAAVHFERGERSYAVACDAYRTVAGNLRAIAATFRAMREIARHGATEIMEQSMDGFLALPPAAPEVAEAEAA